MQCCSAAVMRFCGAHPNSSACRTANLAFGPEMHKFTGKAQCFNSEEVANEAILEGKVKGGDVVVIRHEGPKGGPIAIVENGDLITVDIPNRSLHLHISDEEIEARLARWQSPEPKFKKGYLALYARLAESADKGAIIRNKFE
jgi:dihydroxy-acid dehydratase